MHVLKQQYSLDLLRVAMCFCYCWCHLAHTLTNKHTTMHACRFRSAAGGKLVLSKAYNSSGADRGVGSAAFASTSARLHQQVCVTHIVGVCSCVVLILPASDRCLSLLGPRWTLQAHNNAHTAVTHIYVHTIPTLQHAGA